MKKVIILAALVGIFSAVEAKAQWTNETQYHIPSYRLTYFTNNTADLSAGVSDIVLNQHYVMIPVSNINFMTDGLAATNGSWKSLTYGLVDMLFDQYTAVPVASRSTKQRITRTVRTTTGGDVKFTHTFETDINLGGASTVADE